MTDDEIKMIKYLKYHGSFYLTGSRYWNIQNPELIPLTANTDCDFVAEYHPELVYLLNEKGFRFRDGSFNNMDANAYNAEDGNTVVVLYYGNVQAIFKRGLDVYLAVQNAISPEFYKRFLWKKYNTVPNIRRLLHTLYTIEVENKKRLEETQILTDWGK